MFDKFNLLPGRTQKLLLAAGLGLATLAAMLLFIALSQGRSEPYFESSELPYPTTNSGGVEVRGRAE